MTLSGQAQGSYGRFEGSVVAEWLRSPQEPDRKMKLVEEFKYIDQNGTVWSVPKGAIIDGASVPPVFWISIGPPFVGNYREASVVHDYYCETESEPWEEVHRMFYHATLAGGVPKAKAKAMYAAVYAGGPRWEVITVANPSSTSRMSRTWRTGQGDFPSRHTNIPEIDPPTHEENLTQAKVRIKTSYDREQIESEIEWVEQNNPSLEEIEQRIDRIVQEQHVEEISD